MFQRQAQVVGDHDDAEAELLPQLEQQRQDLAADRGVQRRDRFVGDQQPRPQGQRAGDQHPLLLPAGEFVGVAQEDPFRWAQTRLRERGGHQVGLAATVGVRGHPPVQTDALRHRLVDGLPRVQRAGRVLQHHLHLTAQAPQRPARVDQRLAREAHLPRRRPLQAHEGPGQRGLARPGLADQRQDLAVPHGEVDPVESGRDSAGASGELDPDPLGLQQWYVAHGSPTRKHAAARPPISRSGGSPCVHSSPAREHRGAKAHPGGRSWGSGGSPARPAGA